MTGTFEVMPHQTRNVRIVFDYKNRVFHTAIVAMEMLQPCCSRKSVPKALVLKLREISCTAIQAHEPISPCPSMGGIIRPFVQPRGAALGALSPDTLRGNKPLTIHFEQRENGRSQ
jgi:hypothetical protein